jgi:hypothetical protein
VNFLAPLFLAGAAAAALRIAALLLLAFAFARPFFPGRAETSTGGVTIVALDTSLSLSAPGRFARVQQLAREAVGKAPAGDLVGVVTFSDTAEIAVKPSADRVLATDAIDHAAAGFGATRYRAALSAATQAAAGRASAIVVVTDLQENGWDAGDRVSVREGTRISVVDVGEAPPNLAVTSVRPQPDRVVATIHNASPAARSAKVQLTIDGKAAAEATASLGPHQSGDVLLAAAPRGDAASVSVDDADGIQADNVRYAVLGGTAKPSVLVLSGSGDLAREAFYVQHALAVGANPGSGYQPIGMSGAQLSAGGEEQLAPHAAVLLLSTRGLERRGREALAGYVRGGGGILVAAGPEIDGEVVKDVLGSSSAIQVAAPPDAKREERALAPADVRHPIFQAFAGNSGSLGLVTFQRAARIAGNACQTLARFTTGDVAFVECPAGDGRALLLASDLDNRWNDFPLHATFVPFLHEVVRYVASARPHASEYVVADVPAGVRNSPGMATIPGGSPGAPARRIAVNVDARESNPSRMSADDFQSAVTHLQDAEVPQAVVQAREQEDSQHLWQFLIAAMVLVLVGEGVVASRTA